MKTTRLATPFLGSFATAVLFASFLGSFAMAQTPAHVMENLNEPAKLGPWIKDAPHPSVLWAWRTHHESRDETATVEVHFADRLDYGAGCAVLLTGFPLE